MGSELFDLMPCVIYLARHHRLTSIHAILQVAMDWQLKVWPVLVEPSVRREAIMSAKVAASRLNPKRFWGRMFVNLAKAMEKIPDDRVAYTLDMHIDALLRLRFSQIRAFNDRPDYVDENLAQWRQFKDLMLEFGV